MNTSKQNPKVEVPPEMTEEDDELLDAIWDNLGNKEKKPEASPSVNQAIRMGRVTQMITDREKR